MFGLFSKKKKKEEIVEAEKDDLEFVALVEKWDVFLAKIENRFNESLEHAEEALLENLEESNYDLTPTMVAWSSIKSQLMDLGNKINTTFDEKVLPKMLAYKEHYDLLDESAKGTYLRESVIHSKIDRFEIEIEGKISTLFYNHAVKGLNKDFNCSQCSGAIEVRKDIFHSHYVTCSYCNTVNTFTPNDKISAIRWVVDNIAKYKAIIEWDLMEKARDQFKKIRPPHENQDKTEYINAFKKREETERVFWTKYFTERSEYLPKYKEAISFDVDHKMKHFYEERKRDLNF